NGVGSDAVQDFTLNVVQVLALDGQTHTQWDVNQPGYSNAIAIRNGTPSYSATIFNLPPGLTYSLSGATITISGTPTQTGRYDFDVSAGDGNFASATESYEILVTLTPLLGGLSRAGWDVNQPGYHDTITILFGTGPYRVDVTGLPPGVTASTTD